MTAHVRDVVDASITSDARSLEAAVPATSSSAGIVDDVAVAVGRFCPECGGAQMVGHPAGLLTFRHVLTCGLLAREDGRKMADLDTLRRGGRRFRRDVTSTEATLLAALGGRVAGDGYTYVSRVTASVVLREWSAW